MTAMTLHVGQGKTLELPIDAVTETFAILGIRGSGKTNTAGVIAEELLANGQQVVVVDPTDSWWGLKSSADGKSAGYPVVIMGGKKGDIPLAAGDGKAIADFVVSRRASVVLSTRHFESRADARRFITDFMRRLYHLKGQETNPSPLMVLIDECSIFVPQRVMGEDAPCVGSIQVIARQGRSSGLGIGLIDQRGASVNKDVLSMVEVLICHRTTSPQDRKALRAWIEQHDADDRGAQFLADLATLPRGTAWVWSPGLLDVFKKVAVRQRRTFDSSRTPKAGERVIAPSVVAPVDLDELRASLAATVEKAKADDPKELRKEIVTLKRQLANPAAKAEQRIVEKPVIDQGAIDRAVKLAQRGQAASIAKLHQALEEAMKFIVNIETANFDVAGVSKEELEKAILAAVEKANGLIESRLAVRARELGELRKTAGRMLQRIRSLAHAEGQPVVVDVKATKNEPFTVAAAKESRTVARAIPSPQTSGDGIKITGPEQRILNAIAWLNSVGIDEPEQSAVAFVAGYAENGGFKNPRSALNQKGFVQYKGNAIVLTEHGHLRAEAPEAVTGNDLRERVLQRVPGPERKILSVLIERWPAALSNAELADASGYALNGGFKNPRSRLRTLGLIEYPTPGECRARDILFPDAK